MKTARVLLNTYKLYNDGKQGNWHDLNSDFDLEKIMENFKNSNGGQELMVQDCDNIPNSLYNESCMNFTQVINILTSSNMTELIFDNFDSIFHHYNDINGIEEKIQNDEINIRECYEIDLAIDYIDNLCIENDNPLKDFIDYKKVLIDIYQKGLYIELGYKTFLML